MFFNRKNKKNKVLKDKINQFINTFEDKLDTNVDLVNQKAKENVLNDRKIYNYLVKLAGLKQKKYILPNDFNDIQSIFMDLREDKVEQAKSKMICTNAHSMFYSINFDTFYDGLTFKYKNKLIKHYENIKAELLSKGFINPNFTSIWQNMNGVSTIGIDSVTTSISNTDLIEAGLIPSGFIPSGRNSDGDNMYTYKDPITDVVTTVTIDSNGHILERQVNVPDLCNSINFNNFNSIFDKYEDLYKEVKRKFE